MKKVFELKCTEDGLGRYNATKIYTVFVVCDNSHEALLKVLTDNTSSVEIVSVNPCLIIE